MSRKTNTCPTCGEDSTDSTHTSGYCRPCASELSKKANYLKDKRRPFYRRCVRKKAECTKKGVPFNLDEAYIESLWTGVCPILGVELDPTIGKSNARTPHLDRIDPLKGYVKGNVQWLSARANRIKNNITVEEIERLHKWMVK